MEASLACWPPVTFCRSSASLPCKLRPLMHDAPIVRATLAIRNYFPYLIWPHRKFFPPVGHAAKQKPLFLVSLDMAQGPSGSRLTAQGLGHWEHGTGGAHGLVAHPRARPHPRWSDGLSVLSDRVAAIARCETRRSSIPCSQYTTLASLDRPHNFGFKPRDTRSGRQSRVESARSRKNVAALYYTALDAISISPP